MRCSPQHLAERIVELEKELGAQAINLRGLLLEAHSALDEVLDDYGTCRRSRYELLLDRLWEVGNE